ncbi:MAG: dipeptidyl-peptidase 3 family protein, partial [Bacteroidota bacterium]
MKFKNVMMLTALSSGLLLQNCTRDNKVATNAGGENNFEVECDRFADLQVLRYQIPGFELLSAQQKELAYYLYEAANAGRDIIFDQKYRHNLTIRKTLEVLLENYAGEKTSTDWKNLEVYAKRVFFSNGIHHHYSNNKFTPECGFDFFAEAVKSVDATLLPLNGKSVDEFLTYLKPILFDPKVDAKIVDLGAGIDNVKASANNFYEGVTQAEVEAYYALLIDKKDAQPISWGLNSKMMKDNGKVIEKVWKVGGMYTQAIEKIVYWLEKAIPVAENDKQKKALQLLVEYYKTGDLKKWDEYNIAWVNDTESRLDVVNGF